MKTLRAITLLFLLPVMSCWTYAEKVVDKHGKVWPECVPWSQYPGPHGLWHNGVPFFCSDAGRWEVDKATQKAADEEQTKRRELLAALTRRKLTHNELMRVEPMMNVEPMTSYFPCQKYAEMYELLVKQWELQHGRALEGYVPLSRTMGEYNRCPQADDNLRAVEKMIKELRDETDKTLMVSPEDLKAGDKWLDEHNK